MKKEELLKISKPILFNTEMVKAILEGRKTVTRRVIKLDLGLADTDKNDSSYFKVSDEYGDYHDAKDLCRYQVGDILYVRETWLKADDGYYYRADATPTSEEMRKAYGYKWHPSIHMPKEAARLFLKVTDVRVEKLQNITEEECYNEGFDWQCPYEHRFWVGSPYYGGYESMCWADGDCSSPIKYCDMSIPEIYGVEFWNSMIKKRNLSKYGWEANPWVWVIEFERVEVE